MATSVGPYHMNFKLKISAVLLATSLVGCQTTTKPLYHYGSYQNNVYSHFKNEDSTVLKEIEELEATLAKTSNGVTQIAPGVNAHLGFLYLQSGQPETGLKYLLEEKRLYPESSKFIDFLVSNIKEGKK